jgi:hypothetical protein
MTWPYSSLLVREEPTPTRPVYDIPPVIISSPRWPHLRALAARLLRKRGAIPGGGSAGSDAARAKIDHASS